MNVLLLTLINKLLYSSVLNNRSVHRGAGIERYYSHCIKLLRKKLFELHTHTHTHKQNNNNSNNNNYNNSDKQTVIINYHKILVLEDLFLEALLVEIPSIIGHL